MGDEGRLLQDRLADFTWPMGETQSVVYFRVAFFGLGGFSDV